MLYDDLWQLAEPMLEKIKEHPFWAGLRDGSLPGETLAYFVQQDAGHLLPAYARALARYASIVSDDAHVMLLARSMTGTLEARGRLRDNYARQVIGLGLPCEEPAAADPATHAYASHFLATTATAAGIGTLIPMVMFNFHVSNDLLSRHVAGSRYAEWIAAYHPGEKYAFAVRAFLNMADDIAKDCSARQRDRLVENFIIATRHEWTFADGVYNRATWPI